MSYLDTFEEDDARGTLEGALPAGGYVANESGMWLNSDALDRYRDAVTARVRADVAAFIRANIDIQGLDFPDAESVAVWLEESK